MKNQSWSSPVPSRASLYSAIIPPLDSKSQVEESNPSDTRQGYLLAFFAAICGGAIPTLSKILLAENSPLVVAGFGYLLAGVFLVPVGPKLVPTRKSLPYIVFFGVVGAALSSVLFSVGLSRTTAVNASLLANGEVLFTALLAYAFFGERLGRRQLKWGLLIAAGIFVVSTNLDLTGISFVGGIVGNLLVVVSGVVWSIENNFLVAASRRFGPALITKFRDLLGGALMAGILVVTGFGFAASARNLAVLALLGLALAGVSYLAIAALGKIGAVKTILIFSTSSVFGAVFSLIFLGDQMTVFQLAGGTLILFGVYRFSRSEVRVSQSDGP